MPLMPSLLKAFRFIFTLFATPPMPDFRRHYCRGALPADIVAVTLLPLSMLPPGC
jgi:hypothetical protein